MLTPLALPADRQPSVRYHSANVRFCYSSRRSIQVAELPERVVGLNRSLSGRGWHDLRVSVHQASVSYVEG
jgi:hypothetical protein